jgi:hypothetical protein
MLSVSAVVFFVAASAHAGDGRFEIDQVCVVAGCWGVRAGIPGVVFRR